MMKASVFIAYILLLMYCCSWCRIYILIRVAC